MARDPLANPFGGDLAELEFRALPRPRGPGPVRSAAAATVGTLAAVGPPAESPEDTVEDDSGARDEAVKALVARAQAGDPEAFGELYDRYVDLVYRYIYYRVGGQALAEDLTSET